MKQRSYEKELLDRDNIPFSDILGTMKELNTVNTLLGGHNVTRRGVEYFMNDANKSRPLSVAEIGSGGGDNLTAIHNHLQSKGRQSTLTGVDIKPECIQYASQHAIAGVHWVCSDYRTTHWPAGKPDVIFSSLFCHHFTDDELVEQLGWLRANSNKGFFINDLHRHPVAYHSIRILTRVFSRSHLVVNDAPLSVRRSFTRADWERLLAAAGITSYRISWHWAFRYLICAQW